ncbi:MAG TPA: hypothetical protein VFJ17_11450 [Mycobacteriales bacterium]|nr:hypothetical protein [Mycobacteriales bacterium]
MVVTRRLKKPATDDLSRDVERTFIVVQNEVGVRREYHSVQFEGQLRGVFVGWQLALRYSSGGELSDESDECAMKACDFFLDRARPGTHLERGPGEEAATGKRPALKVIEERVAHREQLR